jgi:hypothetical protein
MPGPICSWAEEQAAAAPRTNVRRTQTAAAPQELRAAGAGSAQQGRSHATGGGPAAATMRLGAADTAPCPRPLLTPPAHPPAHLGPPPRWQSPSSPGTREWWQREAPAQHTQRSTHRAWKHSPGGRCSGSAWQAAMCAALPQPEGAGSGSRAAGAGRFRCPAPHLGLLGPRPRRRRLPRLKRLEHEGYVGAGALATLRRIGHAVILDLEHHVGPADMQQQRGQRLTGLRKDPRAPPLRARSQRMCRPRVAPGCCPRVPFSLCSALPACWHQKLPRTAKDVRRPRGPSRGGGAALTCQESQTCGLPAARIEAFWHPEALAAAPRAPLAPFGGPRLLWPPSLGAAGADGPP